MKKAMFNDKYVLTKAVLDGSKTNTRRIEPDIEFEFYLKNYDDAEIKIVNNNNTTYIDVLSSDKELLARHKTRYAIGEVVAIAQSYKDCGDDDQIILFPYHNTPGWTNKMFVKAEHMPHQIQITDIGIQKLQNISDDDCIAEGIMYIKYIDKYYFERKDKDEGFYFDTPREAFASLIDKVCGKGTWEANPWVFVYEFKLVK